MLKREIIKIICTNDRRGWIIKWKSSSLWDKDRLSGTSYTNMKTQITSILTFVSFAALIPVIVSAVNYCPPFWTHYQLQKGTFCYRYFGVKASWSDAEIQCTKFTICEGKETAHLVSIASMEEEDFVVQYWQSMTGPYPGNLFVCMSVWLWRKRDSTFSVDNINGKKKFVSLSVCLSMSLLEVHWGVIPKKHTLFIILSSSDINNNIVYLSLACLFVCEEEETVNIGLLF